jgi:hypothetical protein
MGQEDDGMQIRNARTGLPVHRCQYRTTRGLSGQDSSAGVPRQDFGEMKSGTEQPEQILLWYSANFSFLFSTLTKFKRSVQDFWVWVSCQTLFWDKIYTYSSKTILLWKLYLSSYLYSKVFYCCLQQRGIQKFPNFFGYLALWFVYATYILNFCISNFKAEVRILKIQVFQRCLPLCPLCFSPPMSLLAISSPLSCLFLSICSFLSGSLSLFF